MDIRDEIRKQLRSLNQQLDECQRKASQIVGATQALTFLLRKVEAETPETPDA